MPELHVVAGPNGAGKTTCFGDLVPEGIDYINADLIAKTIREQAGGLNTQDIANREAVNLFWNKKLPKTNHLQLKRTFMMSRHTSRFKLFKQKVIKSSSTSFRLRILKPVLTV